MAMRPTICIGEWEIDPIDGQIRRNGEIRRLRPKTMAVLLCLAESPEDLVERDEIIERVWKRQLVTDEPLTTCIAELRRVLDDEASHPRYVQTVPKRGYRLVAAVRSLDETGKPIGSSSPLRFGSSKISHSTWVVTAAAVLFIAALWAGFQTATENAGPGSPASGDAQTDPPTIAVLPFLNMSPDPDNEYLAEGIAEEILNSLTKIPGLRVRSRTSSFAIQNQNLDIATIAERLKVSHVLEGSIRRSSNDLRISVQLIDVRADTHVWSDVIEKELQNIFELQGEIATRISEVLEVALDLDQQNQLSYVGTTNTRAYELYLNGRQLIARRTTISISSAAKLFERAIELDPNYAQAYHGLADANMLLPLYNDRPEAEYLKTALQAVKKALEINPDLGEAYATLGSILDEMHDFTGAEQAFRIALERAPRFPTTYHWYGFLLYRMARQEEADELLQRAIDQDPLSNLLSYAYSANLVAMRRFEEAENRYKNIISADPEFSWAYEGMGELSWNGRGDLEAAAQWYQKAVRYDPDSSYFPALLCAISLDAGDAEAAAAWLEKAKALQPDSLIVRSHDALLNVYKEQQMPAYESAISILEDDPKHYLALLISRNHDIAAGQPELAKRRYIAGHPEFMADDVRLDVGNFQAAVDFALVLSELGDEFRAGLLLERAWSIAASYPRHGLPYRMSDVKILAMRGQTNDALDVLEDSHDSGWRPYWWLFVNRDPALSGLRDDVRYRQISWQL